MKKQILIIMIALLLVGTVIAGVNISNRNIETSKEYKTALESINLGDYEYWDNQKGSLFQRCLYKENAINTCSGWMAQNNLDGWEQGRINDIANVTIQRQDADEVVKVTEGEVTITENK